MVEPMLDEIYADLIKDGTTDKFSILNKVIKNIVKNPTEQK